MITARLRQWMLPGPLPDRRRQHLLDCLAIVLVAVALLLRIRAAYLPGLNYDEALALFQANQGSLRELLAVSFRESAHPPLYLIFLRAWLFFGQSELWIRLLSVLAAAPALWFCYRWILRIAGESEALIALLFAAFSPTLIDLTSQARPYSLLLLFLFGTLYYMSVSLKNDKPRPLAVSLILLCLAILTHYSALWVSIALVMFGSVLMFCRRERSRLLSIWLIGIAFIASIYAILYVFQISSLHGGQMEQFATSVWLSQSYYVAAALTRASFLLKGTKSLFCYLFQPDPIGIVCLGAFVIFLGGFLVRVVLLKGKDSLLELGWMGVPPLIFALAALAGLRSLYPFGGSRHDAYLLPFVLYPVSWVFARLIMRRVILAAFGTIVFLLWPLRVTSIGDYNDPARLDKDEIRRNVREIRKIVAPGGIVYGDVTTGYLASYYCGCQTGFLPKWTEGRVGPAVAYDLKCDGFTIRVLNGYWVMRSECVGFMRDDMRNGAGAGAKAYYVLTTSRNPFFRLAERSSLTIDGTVFERVLMSTRGYGASLLRIGS